MELWFAGYISDLCWAETSSGEPSEESLGLQGLRPISVSRERTFLVSWKVYKFDYNHKYRIQYIFANIFTYVNFNIHIIHIDY